VTEGQNGLKFRF